MTSGTTARLPVAPPTHQRRVLVTDRVDGRSRSAIAAVRALAAGGYHPIVAVSGGRSAAAYSRYCAGVLDVPSRGVDYVAAIRQEASTDHYVGVLAASDAALVALGQPGAELVDKSTLAGYARAAGLGMPETRDVAGPMELPAAAGDLGYPVVAKPRIKSGASSVARRIDSPAALMAVAPNLQYPLVLQPFHGDGLRAVCGVIHNGELVAAVHQAYVRIWPPECGVASAAVTTVPDADLERCLPLLLAGHAGVFQVQLIGDLVIDVNPRVYGSLPLALAAGANLPAIACAAAQGDHGDLVRGRPGVHYRWFEGDLRHVIHGVRRGDYTVGAATRALRPRRGTAHSIESLRDPRPALSRLADVLGRCPR